MKKEFNAALETERIIKFIQDYYQKYDLKGVVLGISGGKDSGVVAGLFVRALGPENVVGVALPCHSKEEDRIDAQEVADHYGFKLHDFDLSETFDVFRKQIANFEESEKADLTNSDINLKPRLRMSALYYLAAMFTAYTGKGYLVAGTSNKCELYVGYFTKGGDNVHDLAVIADYTVEEVIQIGEHIKVPPKILYKKPHDGLSVYNDEEKLGVTYEEIANYMKSPILVSETSRQLIKSMHEGNQHKFSIPTYRRGE